MAYFKRDQINLSKDRERLAQKPRSNIPDPLWLKQGNVELKFTTINESGTGITATLTQALEYEMPVDISHLEFIGIQFADNYSNQWMIFELHREYNLYDLKQVNSEQSFPSKSHIETLLETVEDPIVELAALYELMDEILEESLYYYRKGIALYKDAIQNAVDIVQSQRIAFGEAGKQPSWTGILFSIALVLFIELAALQAGVLLAGSLLKGLTRISPRFAARLTGSNKTKNGIVLLDNFHTQRTAVEKGFLSKQRIAPEIVPSSEQIRHVFDKGLLIGAKEKLDGKLDYQQLVETFTAQFGEKFKVFAKTGKEVSGGFVSKQQKKQSTPASPTIGHIPIDVAFKMYLQTLWDQDLFYFERLARDIKVLKDSPLSPETAKTELKNAWLVQEYVLKLQTFAEMIKNHFENGSIGQLSSALTSNFELRIWTLLYGTDLATFWALGFSSHATRSGVSRWVHPPIDVQSAEKYRESELEEFWRIISEEQYIQWEQDGKIVKINGEDYGHRRTFILNYLKNRFSEEFGGMETKQIAKAIGEMHVDMMTEIQKTESSIVWQDFNSS